MTDKNLIERLISYIGFFYIFDGIVITTFTILFTLTSGFSNILSPFTTLFGYYPSNTYILILNIIMGIASLFVGIGLLSHSPIARIGAIILAVPKLIDIPYGTIFGLWIIVTMVLPQSNLVFGKFSVKKIPYRVAGVLIIAVSFFAFAGMSGYLDDVTSDISITMMGFPQSNLSPMDKIRIAENDIEQNNDVIVELTAPVGKYAIQQQNEIIPQLQTLGIIEDAYNKIFNGVHMKVDRDKLTELASNPYVKYIYKNNVNYLYTGEITAVECLDDTSNLLNTQWLWDNGYDGDGVVVAVIDSGINEDMEYLQRDGESVVVASYEKYDDWVHWHGTAVASCIASQNIDYAGVAPMAKLIDVEVFIVNDDQVIAYDSDILWGYEKVAEFKQEHGNYFVIASCSFGVPAELIGDTWSNPAPTSRGANALATEYGIPVVAAAGNDGISFKISSPAAAQYVLAVGAVDKNKQPAYFTSRGPTPDGHKKPDVCNIGVDVRTFDPDGRLIVVSGTSFSTPLTSGIMACIATKDDGYSAVDYYDAFKYSANDISPRGFDYTTGYGFVDGKEASEIIGKVTPKKVFTIISFSMIFVGVGIVFYPEWSGIIWGGRRKWINI